MTQYPLFFTFKELVYGDGFVAECAMQGRALAVQEEEREWWFNGVEPGGLAERGETLNDAYFSFRDTLKEILFDISYTAETFEAFEAKVKRFMHDVNRPHDEDWWLSVEAGRKGELQAPAPNMREHDADKEAYAYVTLVDPAKVKPSGNELGGIEYARRSAA